MEKFESRLQRVGMVLTGVAGEDSGQRAMMQ